MKLKSIAIAILLCSQTFVFCQFTGTNPAVLNGAAIIKDNLTLGYQIFGPGTTPIPDRKLNIYRTFNSTPIVVQGSPLSTYTTGLKIGYVTPSETYNWEVAAKTDRMYFHYANSNKTIMTLNNDGKVGIGTNNPTSHLHVRNSSFASGSAIRADAINGHIRLYETDGSNNGRNYTQIERNGDSFHIYQKEDGQSYQHVLTAKMNGNVGIGTADPEGYKLAVKGDVIAEKVVVKLHANWPDFVFTKKYDLMPLEDVENFIQKNSHLPNVPSAKEVENGGIDLGAMDATLLQKVEELTLYVIELKKEIEMLKK